MSLFLEKSRVSYHYFALKEHLIPEYQNFGSKKLSRNNFLLLRNESTPHGKIHDRYFHVS